MSASEEILARYAQVEHEVDAFGRKITVKRLPMDVRIRVIGFCEGEGDLAKSIIVTAASVRAIDDNPITPPRNRADVDAVVRSLDEEGLAAAGVAFRRIHGIAEVAPEDAVELGKN